VAFLAFLVRRQPGCLRWPGPTTPPGHPRPRMPSLPA
jgi:hypothetical protein